MALSITVSKKSVILAQEKLYQITLNMIATDNSVEVINQDFIQLYRPGDNINSKVVKFQTEMQAAIDKYKAEQNIYNNSTLTSVVTWLNSNLTG